MASSQTELASPPSRAASAARQHFRFAACVDVDGPDGDLHKRRFFQSDPVVVLQYESHRFLRQSSRQDQAGYLALPDLLASVLQPLA